MGCGRQAGSCRGRRMAGWGWAPAVAQNLKRCWQNRVAIMCHGRRLFLHARPQSDGNPGATQAIPHSKRHPSPRPPALYIHIFACLERAVMIGGQEVVGRTTVRVRLTRTSRCRPLDAKPPFFVPSRVADRVAVAICFTTTSMSCRESRRSIAIRFF